jgi:tripartite-type tricarboxylate transporter receptor subunit TctC
MKAIAKGIALGLMLTGLLAAMPVVGADDYPNRNVTIVVPFAPGGSTDALARFEAEVLQRELRQSFIVESRAGAGGVLGISYVAKAAADGYTLLHTPTAFGLIPYLQKNVPYDPVADFAPIALVGVTNFCLVVGP